MPIYTEKGCTTEKAHAITQASALLIAPPRRATWYLDVCATLSHDIQAADLWRATMRDNFGQMCGFESYQDGEPRLVYSTRDRTRHQLVGWTHPMPPGVTGPWMLILGYAGLQRTPMAVAGRRDLYQTKALLPTSPAALLLYQLLTLFRVLTRI